MALWYGLKWVWRELVRWYWIFWVLAGLAGLAYVGHYLYHLVHVVQPMRLLQAQYPLLSRIDITFIV